jgi:hypothetical protein
LRPRTPVGRDWLTRFKVGRLAKEVGRGIVRELPGSTVSDKAGMAGETWAIAVRLPAGVCAQSFAAGMRAEGLPCEPGRTDGVVYVPLCPSYSAEDAEHVVLGAAKVAHYLMEALPHLRVSSAEGGSA